jgi:hypothetical protein
MIYHNSALLIWGKEKNKKTKQHKVKHKKKEGIPSPGTAVCCWEVDGNVILLPVPVLLLLLLSLLSLSVEDDDTEPDLFCCLAARWNGFSCNMNI